MISHASPDPTSFYPHLAALETEPPKDPSRYELAQQRASEVFEKFRGSKEEAALGDGARWSPLFLRTAYVHHGVTIDELDANVVRDVAQRFVRSTNIASLAHWTAVVHDELVAFFRFLLRTGFEHAAENLRVLEGEILPHVEAHFRRACTYGAEDLTIRPLGNGLTELIIPKAAFGPFTSSTPLRTPSPPPFDPQRRRQRKAQRAARRKNR
jgi:hypothetical protein